jgi:hypothetical protein
MVFRHPAGSRRISYASTSFITSSLFLSFSSIQSTPSNQTMKFLLHLTTLSLVIAAETKLRGKKRNVLNLEEDVLFFTHVRNLQMSVPNYNQGDGDLGIPPPAAGVPTPMPTSVAGGGGSAFPTAIGGSSSLFPTSIGSAASTGTSGTGGGASAFPTSIGSAISTTLGTGGGASAFPTAGAGVLGATSSFPTSSVNGAVSSFPTSMNAMNGAASTFPTGTMVALSSEEKEFICPPADFVGCTASDESVDECTTVGEPCEDGGKKYCCQDACPRNYCTAMRVVKKANQK